MCFFYYLPIFYLYICLFYSCIFAFFVFVYLPNFDLYICLFCTCIFAFFCICIFAYFVFVFLLLQFCIFVAGAGELAAISALEAFSCRALFALNASNRNPPHTAPRPSCCCIFHRICVYFDVIFFIQHPGHHVTVFPPYLCLFQCNFFLSSKFSVQCLTRYMALFWQFVRMLLLVLSFDLGTQQLFVTTQSERSDMSNLLFSKSSTPCPLYRVFREFSNITGTEV